MAKLILEHIYDKEAKNPDRVFLTQPIGGGEVKDYTWKQVVGEARRIAKHLQTLGLEPGDRVAMLSKNCAHFFMAELAIWMAVTDRVVDPVERGALADLIDQAELPEAAARRLQDLAADDELLQVAARERLGRGRRAAALDVELVDAAPREGACTPEAQEAGGHHALVVRRGEERVVGERHRRHRAAAEALFGHEGHAEPPPPPGRQPAGLDAADLHGEFLRQRLLARDHAQQLLLAVARYAGDADDLAGVNVEMEVAQVGAEGVVRGVRQPRQAQAELAAGLRRVVLAARQLLADHQARHRLRALLRRDALAGDLAAAQHGGGVAELADLVELVADVEDGAAVVGEPAQGLEELAHRLRGEHRGRLVHDQQARILQQAADDLDALALAHRQGVDVAARIDREAVALRHLDDALRELVERGLAGQGQRHVLDHGEGLEQREVLEHHADAQAARVRRALDFDLLALPEHASAARPGDAVDDLHQRGFARAVLAEDGADLACAHREADVVVGDDRRIYLADALQDQPGGAGGVRLRSTRREWGGHVGSERFLRSGSGQGASWNPDAQRLPVSSGGVAAGGSAASRERACARWSSSAPSFTAMLSRSCTPSMLSRAAARLNHT